MPAADMFCKVVPVKKKRRVLAHVIDAKCDFADGLSRVVFRCNCGWKSDWIVIQSFANAKRGIPCAACNKSSLSGPVTHWWHGLPALNPLHYNEDRVMIGHAVVPMQTLIDGVHWCEVCGGHPDDPVHQPGYEP